MLCKTQSLASDLLGHALDLEHDAAGLDDGHPLLGVTLTRTHASLGRLLGDGLIGEDRDVDTTATLHVAGHGNTSGLDLTVGDPMGLESLDTKLAEMQLGITLGLALHGATLHLAVKNTLRGKHY